MSNITSRQSTSVHFSLRHRYAAFSLPSPAILAALGPSFIRAMGVGFVVLTLSACELLSKPEPEAPPPQAQVAKPVQPTLPSADPLPKVDEIHIRYAQRTLSSNGFNAGQADGIWGPRSARAMRGFEQKFGLKTANGFLSELNLFMLEKVSNTRRPLLSKPQVQATTNSIADKLDQSTPLADAPQLVFLEQAESMLAKPNPFSEQLAELLPGTGIYVISEQEGWFEVESEDKQRGFIKAQ